MSNAQFFQQLQDLANYEAKKTQTLPAENETSNETFTVKFYIDSECFNPEHTTYPHKITGDQVIVTVPNVDETLIESLQDDELAEFFGLESEGLIYTNRGVL